MTNKQALSSIIFGSAGFLLLLLLKNINTIHFHFSGHNYTFKDYVYNDQILWATLTVLFFCILLYRYFQLTKKKKYD